MPARIAGERGFARPACPADPRGVVDDKLRLCFGRGATPFGWRTKPGRFWPRPDRLCRWLDAVADRDPPLCPQHLARQEAFPGLNSNLKGFSELTLLIFFLTTAHPTEAVDVNPSLGERDTSAEVTPEFHARLRATEQIAFWRPEAEFASSNKSICLGDGATFLRPVKLLAFLRRKLHRWQPPLGTKGAAPDRLAKQPQPKSSTSWNITRPAAICKSARRNRR